MPSTSSTLHEYAPRCSQQYESTATRFPLYASLTCIVLTMDFRDGSNELIPIVFIQAGGVPSKPAKVAKSTRSFFVFFSSSGACAVPRDPHEDGATLILVLSRDPFLRVRGLMMVRGCAPRFVFANGVVVAQS